MEQERTLDSGFILKGNHHYTIKKTLNRGGFGITYLAEAEYMDHHISQVGTYAIKEFFPEGISRRHDDHTVEPLEGKKNSFKESYNEFKAEADCLYDLHHPGIVPVNEVIEANGTVYYVMKFLRGKTLEDWVAENGGRLSVADAIAILTKVADAVSYLHAQNILHLDVKPDNIMMTDSGPVLIDFGSFRRFKPNGSLETKKTSRCVSDGFSPDEQYKGIERFTPQSDVYALGATLFYMLTGEIPVEAEQMSKKWVYAHTPSSVSEQTADAIVDAMAKNVDDRTPSVSDMMSALQGDNVAQDRRKKKGRTRRITVDINRKREEEKKKMLKMAAVAAAAIVACLLLFLLLKPSANPSPDNDDKERTDTTQTSNSDTTKIEPAVQAPASAQSSPLATPQAQTAPQTPSTAPAPTPTQNSTAIQPQPASTTSAPTPSIQATSGSLDLGYAVWNGEIVDGKPDGKGTMTFRSSHLIDSRDINQSTAEAGDKVTGLYSKGHLVRGTWTKTNGETKKLLIGQ